MCRKGRLNGSNTYHNTKLDYFLFIIYFCLFICFENSILFMYLFLLYFDCITVQFVLFLVIFGPYLSIFLSIDSI